MQATEASYDAEYTQQTATMSIHTLQVHFIHKGRPHTMGRG